MDDEKLEQRRLKRWRLIYHLRLFDRDSGASLGHVADISMRGLMLVHDMPIELEKDYSLSMEYVNDSGEVDTLCLQGRSRWTGKNANPRFWNTGFSLSDPPEEAVELIMSMVDELGFDD